LKRPCTNLYGEIKLKKIFRKKLEFESGGRRMANIDTFITSLKLTWIRRIFTTNSYWMLFLKLLDVIHVLTN
jgi:hypothetical protein